MNRKSEQQHELKPVRVTWFDSVANSGWCRNPKELIEQCAASEMLHESVGYLVEATKERVLLCMNRGTTLGSVGEAINIPRSVVKSIEYLRKR